MKYTKLIEEIRTIRDFKKDTVDPKIVAEIVDAGKNSPGLAQGRNVNILFIDNGRELVDKLSGKAGYFGKIMEAPHYLVITSKEFEGFMENSGYLMETMRLKAWEKGIGSCWLSVEEEASLKEVLDIGNEERLTALVALGYQYKGIFKADISPRTGRQGLEELVYFESWGNPCPMEILENRGLTNILHYTKYAPSWGNKQPWRFVLDKERVILTVEKDDKVNFQLDAGIVMLYFEKSAMEEGLSIKWTFLGEEVREAYHIPNGYKIIAEMNV